MNDASVPFRTFPAQELKRSFVLGVGVFAGLLLAGWLEDTVLRGVPLGAVVALVLALLGGLHARMTRHVPARAPIATHLALLALVPFVMLAGTMGVTDPIISTRFWCGTGRMELLALAVPVLGGVAAAACFVATLLVSRGGRRFDATIARAAVVAVFAGTVLFTAGAFRSARAPDRRSWIESLPVKMVLPAAEGATPFERLPTAGSDTPTNVYVDVVEDLTVRRSCGPKGAEIAVGRNGPPRVVADFLSCSQPVFFRHDARHHLWIVDTHIAFSDDTLAPRDVLVADVRDALGPNRGTVAVAGIGLAVAAWLARKRHAAVLALAPIARGLSGFAEERDWIVLDDALGTVRVEMPEGASPLEGAVVVLSGARAASSAYRGDGPFGRVTVVAGDKGELLAKANAGIAALGVQIIATVALTAAPLLAAAIAGLVF